MKFTTILAAAVAAVIHTGAAQPFAVPKSDRAVSVDGVLLPEEYPGAAIFAGAGDWRTAAREKRPVVIDPRTTECAVTWTETALHFAFRSKTAPGGKLVRAEKNAPCGSGDSVEIWLSPPASARQGEFARFGQFQLIVEWTGRVFTRQHNPGYGLPARHWKIEGLKLANTVRGDIWDCEIALPASAFGAESFTPGEWGCVIGRNFCSEPSVQSTYSPFSDGTYADEDKYFKLSLVPGGPASRVGAAPALIGRPVAPKVPANITARVKASRNVPAGTYRRYLSSRCCSPGYFGVQQNSAHDARQEMLLFYHGIGRSYAKNFHFSDTAPIGEEIVYSINVFPRRLDLYVDGRAVGSVPVDVDMTADTLGEFVPDALDGAEMLSFCVRDRALDPDEIKAEAQAGRGVSGTLKWYPSGNLIAAELNFPASMIKTGRPTVRVFDPKGKLVAEYRLPREGTYVVSKGNTPMVTLHDKLVLPRFPGKGRCRMTLEVEGERTPVIDRTFKALAFDWFNTQLGNDDIILPGFAPLKVDGASIRPIGRSYNLRGGLPAEMISLGQSILARPVELIAVQDGKSRVLDTGTLAFGKKSATAVTYTSRGGDVAVDGRVEQDGLLILKLAFPEKMAAERVYMDVTLKKEYAQLFHACGEGLRSNPAGGIPAKTGRVFGSREIPQSHSDNFIPYCWRGTDDRGVLYAADVDRDWLHVDSRDAVELIRLENGDVTMRLNLLNAPSARSRAITLCLQATPLKPLPKGCRGWADTFPDVPCTRALRNLASTPTWSCFIVGMGRYPTFMDFDHVRRLRKTIETGKIDEVYKNAWIERCWAEYEKKSPLVPWLNKVTDPREARQTLVNHVNAEFYSARMLHGKPDPCLYYYTCNADPCTGLYEMSVMADEWTDFTSTYGSHQDYAIYYLDKMIEAGMGGVYNDNAFFRCNYDWVTGDAWIDETGRVHPSFSLWALRSHTRRQMTVMARRLKNPWLTIHHTNAYILPALGFATNMMGMEWKYGNAEFQDRFTTDYIRAVNQGLQGGHYATSLGGIINVKSDAERTWLTRTQLATLLTHEIRPTLGNFDEKLFTGVLTKMLTFGIAADDCVYTAYWDPENPVTCSDPDVKVSTYRRGADLLLVIGSFADADRTVKLTLPVAPQSARNAETGAPVDPGALKIPRRDFALIEVRGVR